MADALNNLEISGVEGDTDIEKLVAEADAREAAFKAGERNTLHDGEAAPKANAATKPDGVPDEFWDAEKGEVDWAKLSAKLNGTPEEKPAEGAEEFEKTGAVINGIELTTKHNEDFAPFYEQYQADGTVPEDAVKYVKDTFGIDATPDMIGAYMGGQLQKATGKASQAMAEIHSAGMGITGGEANYAAMAAWAVANLPEAEIAEYDSRVNGTDAPVAKLAVQALWNRYRAEGGAPVKLPGSGRLTPSASGDTYSSFDELVKDTGSARYDADPVFRAQVDAKIRRSGSLSIPSY